MQKANACEKRHVTTHAHAHTQIKTLVSQQLSVLHGGGASMAWLLKDHEFLVVMPQWEPNLYLTGGGDPGDLAPLVLSLPPSSMSCVLGIKNISSPLALLPALPLKLNV